MRNLGQIQSIAELDRRIQFQTYSASLNVYGEESLSWSELATVWAKLDWTGSDETEDGDQEVTGTDIVATIRRRSDINTKQRVLYNSKYYDITGIVDVSRNRFQKVFLKIVE